MGHLPNFASDVFSFGVLVNEIFSRKEPYEGEGDLESIIKEVTDVTSPFPRYV